MSINRYLYISLYYHYGGSSGGAESRPRLNQTGQGSSLPLINHPESAERVDPESGKAAGLSRSQLRLSKWAKEYERGLRKIWCPQRERNNRQRVSGPWTTLHLKCYHAILISPLGKLATFP